MSDENLEILIDRLIPRGGDTPTSIFVSLEDYLSRLSNLNRKLSGTKYRFNQWQKACEEHKNEFNRKVLSETHLDKIKKSGLKINSISYRSRNIKLENEFEMLLYSLTSTLSSLTRFVSCFLKGSTQTHSHSKLLSTLSKRPGFESLYSIIDDACSTWSLELTERRDAGIHYIALAVISTIQHKKKEAQIFEKKFLQIGIPKAAVKHYSVWEDDLPIIGGASHTRLQSANGDEINIIEDSNRNVILRRERPLENRPDSIDGELYIDKLVLHFSNYTTSVFEELITKLYDGVK